MDVYFCIFVVLVYLMEILYILYKNVIYFYYWKSGFGNFYFYGKVGMIYVFDF